MTGIALQRLFELICHEHDLALVLWTRALTTKRLSVIE